MTKDKVLCYKYTNDLRNVKLCEPLLASLADAIEDPEEAKKLWSETSVDKIFDLLSENL